jgi:hypothetical protein
MFKPEYWRFASDHTEEINERLKEHLNGYYIIFTKDKVVQFEYAGHTMAEARQNMSNYPPPVLMLPFGESSVVENTLYPYLEEKKEEIPELPYWLVLTAAKFIEQRNAFRELLGLEQKSWVSLRIEGDELKSEVLCGGELPLNSAFEILKNRNVFGRLVVLIDDANWSQDIIPPNYNISDDIHLVDVNFTIGNNSYVKKMIFDPGCSVTNIFNPENLQLNCDEFNFSFGRQSVPGGRRWTFVVDRALGTLKTGIVGLKMLNMDAISVQVSPLYLWTILRSFSYTLRTDIMAAEFAAVLNHPDSGSWISNKNYQPPSDSLQEQLVIGGFASVGQFRAEGLLGLNYLHQVNSNLCGTELTIVDL